MTRLYWMDTSDLDMALLTPSVPQWRQEKIARYRFDKDKKLSLGASLLLRLCGITDEVAYTEHGKPYFAHRSDVRFSLSHSGTCAVCAVSDREVGCDVEKIDPRHLSLADACLTEREKAFLSASDDPARDFTRFWVAKESIMKCSGLGFALPPRSIDFDMESGKWQRYRVAEYADIAGYRLALCMEETEFETAQPEQIPTNGLR